MSRWLRSFRKNFFNSQRFRRENQVFIMPTGKGLLFGILLLSGLSMAYLFDEFVLFFGTFMFAAVYLLCAFATNEFMRGLQFELWTESKFREGALIPIRIRVKNKSRIPSFSIRFREEEGRPHNSLSAPAQLEPPSVELSNLAANQEGTLILRSSPLARGVYSSLWFRSYSRAPLGFFEAWRWIRYRKEIVVGPRGVGVSWEIFQGAQARAFGAGDFFDFVSWTSSDPVRSIHWRSKARRGDLLRKRYDEPKETPVHLSWSATQFAGDFEARLSQLQLWIEEMVRRSRPFSIEIPGLRLAQGERETDLIHRSLALASENEWQAPI